MLFRFSPRRKLSLLGELNFLFFKVLKSLRGGILIGFSFLDDDCKILFTLEFFFAIVNFSILISVIWLTSFLFACLSFVVVVSVRPLLMKILGIETSRYILLIDIFELTTELKFVKKLSGC